MAVGHRKHGVGWWVNFALATWSIFRLGLKADLGCGAARPRGVRQPRATCSGRSGPLNSRRKPNGQMRWMCFKFGSKADVYTYVQSGQSGSRFDNVLYTRMLTPSRGLLAAAISQLRAIAAAKTIEVYSSDQETRLSKRIISKPDGLAEQLQPDIHQIVGSSVLSGPSILADVTDECCRVPEDSKSVPVTSP